MPTTVTDLFAVAGLRPGGVVRWGTAVPATGPGNYVVSLSEDADSLAGARTDCPVDDERLRHLLHVRPELLVDGRRPSPEDLAARLQAFWLADEVAVYIGLAGTSLRNRVRQYYRTPIGAKRPHAGGWWLKTLATLDELWVHHAPTIENAKAEAAMLQKFARGVPPDVRMRLHDPHNPAPWANLRTGRGNIKAHGIRGATGDLESSSVLGPTAGRSVR